MQLSPKLVLALAVALAAPGAFAATNGDSDNDWLMKKAVPSGTAGTTSSQAQPGSASASAAAPVPTAAAAAKNADKPFVSSVYTDSDDGLP
ncbi:MAG TPA: hypothetical protein VH105_08110 [Burkholderiales bacterium]|nr:hypothetical protein [Burkholderiales bacterium]